MKTTLKGNLGELKVATHLLMLGFKIALPYGEDWAYDLIFERDSILEKVQVKYVESDGKVIKIKCGSELHNFQSKTKERIYTPYQGRVDWVAAYDKTTDCCYYVHNTQLNSQAIWLRISSPKRNISNIKWATNYLLPTLPT